MKILQIDVLCGVGSTGRIVTDLANCLKVNGHDCLVCFGRGEAKQWNKTYKISGKWDTRYHGLMARLRDRCGLHSKRATKKLIKVIIEYNPDIIHLHDIHGYYVNLEILFNFLKEFGKPVVWGQYDCWAITGHCSHFDFVGCDKWRTQCVKCQQKSEYPKTVLFSRTKRNYRDKKKWFAGLKKMVLVAPSKWLAGLIEQSFLGEYPVRVIPTGIDTNVFKPVSSDFRVRHGLENRKVVLGVTFVWSQRKGLDDFIKLSTMLSDEYQIVLVGLNDKQLKDLPRKILGIKRTANVQQLAEIYSMADVFVNPTYEDSFPTTNLEALACGTDVITYNTGGSVESVSHDNICEQGNVNMLCDMIKKVASKNKTNVSLKNFKKEEMMEAYLKLYNSLN